MRSWGLVQPSANSFLVSRESHALWGPFFGLKRGVEQVFGINKLGRLENGEWRLKERG
jgi:hypothetical protein